jgi:hypothetical protein
MRYPRSGGYYLSAIFAFAREARPPVIAVIADRVAGRALQLRYDPP